MLTPTAVGTTTVRRAWLSTIAYAVGFLPLTVAYYAQLWSLPHYQFFPWAFLGAWALAARRSPPAEPSPSRPVIRGGLFAGSLLLLAAAVVLDSPWLGCAASFAAAAAFVYDAWGASAWRRFGPAGLLLLTTLRLPLGADLYLITTLQRLTARAASATLDTFDVVHYLAGNVIVIPGRRLLIEEACSGVNSLFSAGCGTLFLLLWGRRSLVFSLVLLLSVPVWVVLANTARVTATTVLRTEFGIAADEGRLHDALGLAVFALAMLLILSTERLLHFYDLLVTPDEAPLRRRKHRPRSRRRFVRGVVRI
jgi:exosortase